jgi:hypothetical protein
MVFFSTYPFDTLIVLISKVEVKFSLEQAMKPHRRSTPVEARFSAPVQTGPGGPPSLVYNGYRVSFPGVNHPLPSSAEVRERVELYLYPL